MKKSYPISPKIVRKRVLRSKKFKLHRKLLNCGLCSWDVIERAENDYRLAKYPRRKLIRKVLVVSNQPVRFLVPSNVDIYINSNYEDNNHFLGQIRDCTLRKGRKIYLDFSNTKKISAAAMLSLLAEVDVITRKSEYGIHAVSFNHPKDEKVESILKQIGFYDLLKKKKRETEEYEDVTFWKYTSGVCSEPLLAMGMIKEIKEELESRSISKKLYRGFVEAMSNSVEHAYVDDREHTDEDMTAKWWTFAGIRGPNLVVVICDKGVGIPRTLPKTQGADRLYELLKEWGINPFKVKDSTFIKAASSLSRTRTGQSNRGKGLNDMKSVIDLIGAGYLSIFSNCGRYTYKGDNGVIKEFLYDHKKSVSGTIVEWTIPLEGGKE